ncbi:phosphoribosylformylglycinamidine cyclo-ligase [Caloranaerobacter azorensis]|uniref:Phosphoribosylformylglycinamidine cyclo-ligase n=1 Tax=Caloranaerobacter azorensis TaxID=116090 RepID=A0A6P1YDJ0_9FIRM|nr:phosphoribosylformylglycinamidine cyclo-ligase [Caloranaerobacter azorensis]QIB27419.1 phosphoribosylformylglycinamidine cyclo-ligase [Caloranaerobacter azorensis]
MSTKGITYKDAGVDIKAGYEAVNLIKEHVKKTYTKGVMSSIGGFSGLFKIDTDKYKEPILVSGTDGVGTKLKVAYMMDKHDTIGEDCVAMCVNDILCQGAKPLFFLDYIGTYNIEPTVISKIVEGVANGCVKAGCALIGGETAEMPGVYSKGEYDLVGFAVGIVDKDKIIDGLSISEGDVLIGLKSSGLHSNGFSLVRKLFFEIEKFSVNQYVDELGTTLGEELLKPTRIYADVIEKILDKYAVKGMSHITGGGFYENIPRMLPEGFVADIDVRYIDTPAIFKLIEKLGRIDKKEMYSTFNMGIGMVIAVDKEDGDKVLDYLNSIGERAYLIGEIKKGEGGIRICHQ